MTTERDWKENISLRISSLQLYKEYGKRLQDIWKHWGVSNHNILFPKSIDATLEK